MASREENLTSLAAKVSELTNTLTAYLESRGLSSVTFAADSEAAYPLESELTETRMKLIEALTDMLHLAKGGKDFIFMESLISQHNTMILDVLNQFDFWHAIPLHGSATYSDIATHVQLPESLVRRILRYAMTARLFAETAPGSGNIVHTSTTAFIVRNPTYMSWIGHNLEDVRPATVQLPEALRRHSYGKKIATERLDESAFAVAFGDKAGCGGNFWALLEKDGDGAEKSYRARRFAQAMQIAGTSAAVSFEQLIKAGFDWGSVGDGVVVDVGGSSGHEAICIAQHHPSLKVIVQDLPSLKDAFTKAIPLEHELASRITFQPHDFFQPQTVVADVYFMKAVLHDWPDEQASEILRALVPALRPGVRIVLCEGLAPAFDTEEWDAMPWAARQMLSALDLQMLVQFNAKQRTAEDWTRLFASADSRLRLARTFMLPGGAWALLEVMFCG